MGRTKQSTLLLEGNVLKLGPELNVSCQGLIIIKFSFVV